MLDNLIQYKLMSALDRFRFENHSHPKFIIMHESLYIVLTAEIKRSMDIKPSVSNKIFFSGVKIIRTRDLEEGEMQIC